MHNAYAMPTDFAYTQCLPAMHTHLCLPTLPTHLCPPTLPTHLCLPTYAYPHCLPSYAYPQCLPTYAYSQCLPTYAYPQYLPTYAYPQYLPTYAYSLMPTHAYAYPRRRHVVPKARNNLVRWEKRCSLAEGARLCERLTGMIQHFAWRFGTCPKSARHWVDFVPLGA
jgi:hypothetical protein